MNFFAWRRMRKQVRHLLHEARHARHMTEDIAEPALVDRVLHAETALAAAWTARDNAGIESAADGLVEAVNKLYPPRSYPRWRENVEILVVAVSVAMAFRTFFVQPFKIPTGSMQPTLYGITLQPPSKVRAADTMPLSWVNTALFGRLPVTIRSPFDGRVSLGGRMYQQEMILGKSRFGTGLRVRKMDSPYTAQMVEIADPSSGVFIVPVPVDFELAVKPGDTVKSGDVLARGIIKIGDHIFVNKVKYNFARPKRGDVIVFDTDRIDHPEIRKNNFYIKRLVGLPNERVQVHPPHLVVDGKEITEPYPFQRLLTAEGYHGYQLALSPTKSMIRSEQDVIPVGAHEFLPFGDNTEHSLDGRYFGPVVEKSLVGPAFMVYWPFSTRWGWIR